MSKMLDEARERTQRGFAFAGECDGARKFREIRRYRLAPVSANLILGFSEPVLGIPRSY